MFCRIYALNTVIVYSIQKKYIWQLTLIIDFVMVCKLMPNSERLLIIFLEL
jgi:hypothetical protein